MTSSLIFQFPAGWQAGLPLVLVLLGFRIWRQRRRGLARSRIARLAGLRLVVLLAAGLSGRAADLDDPRAAGGSESPGRAAHGPQREHVPGGTGPDAVSASAANSCGNGCCRRSSRRACRCRPCCSTRAPRPPTARSWRRAAPNGKRTNLAGAIAQAISAATQPPLAVIALTDGIVNESADNTRALTALVDARVPFIGVGVGSDQGVRTLSLRDVEAPAIVPTKTAFQHRRQLEMINADDMPAFDLVLFRDGQMLQKKTVAAGQRLAHLAGELPGHRGKAGRAQLHRAIAAAESAWPQMRQHAGEHRRARLRREGTARALHPGCADLGLQVHQPGVAQRSDHQDDRPDPHVEAIRVPPERGERGRTDERVPDHAGGAGALPGGGALEPAPGGPDARRSRKCWRVSAASWAGEC